MRPDAVSKIKVATKILVSDEQIIYQIRQLLGLWGHFSKHWSHQQFEELCTLAEELVIALKQQNELELLKIVEQLLATLAHFNPAWGSFTSEQSLQLHQCIQALSNIGLRKTDTRPAKTATASVPVKKSIYLALNDPGLAERLSKQLRFFGFETLNFNDTSALETQMSQQRPIALLIDVDFGAEKQGGIKWASGKDYQKFSLPIMFYSAQEDNIQLRLAAVRAGSQDFLVGAIETGYLIERMGIITQSVAIEPYRVLIVEDDKSQAFFTQTILNKAGMVTKVVTQPLQVLTAIEEFHPELIVMDIYMPDCNGIELAQVIRQQEKYISVPILFLSAEEDTQKQLQAMSTGGDDFLTKPIKPNNLISSVKNRAERARALLNLMVKDSLTGLYNHTHTFYKLNIEIESAYTQNQSLSFVMLDIDHFKKINDSYGHPVGDRVLKSLSLFLRQRLRKTDTVGRYGGEEFAIILPNTSGKVAVSLMNKIREGFSELKQSASNVEFSVTFSVGIAELTANNSKQLVELTDIALYEAKRAGRNCVQLFSPSTK